MTIDWIEFLPALVLLLTPGDLLNRGSKVRHRHVARGWEGYWSRTIIHGPHTIDFVRALSGTWLLFNSVHSAPDAGALARYEVLILQGGIRLAAVFLQTAVCREQGSSNAPFAFVAGLLLAGIAPVGALLGLVLAVAVAFGTHAPLAFFPTLALIQFGLGFWFQGRSALVYLGFDALVAAMPFLWAVMFRRDLVATYRAKRADPTRSHSPKR